MEKKKKPTIQDVAKLAGVSKATVSKYLNNIPYVSQRSQKKIEKAIKQLGFKPNIFARGLVNKFTGLIGVVFSDLELMINIELIKAIELEASKYEYNVVLVSTNDNDLKERKLPDVLGQQYQHLDGLILANVREDGVDLSKIQEMFQYIVTVHRHIEDQPIDYAIVDGYIGGRLATEYLISLGHKNIVMVSGPTSIQQYKERIRGFWDTLREHGLEQNGHVLETNQTIEDGYRAAEKIVLEWPSATAVFAGSDLLALGILDAARDYGWDIPGDLSVIGFDNIFFSRLARVPLTTIDGRIRELGEIAVRLLMERIKGEREEVKQIRLQPSLVVRESCTRLS